MRGKLILIEGTDGSGKETQTKKLVSRLKENGYNVFLMSFPDYNSPTGKIVGGPYLGKTSICESYFAQGAVKLDPRVAGHYFAADRLDKKPIIEDHLKNGEIVILDRYVTSNMAHQGSKYENVMDRMEFYLWCINMEYVNNKLPQPDMTIFLHMPFAASYDLKKDRNETDEHELDSEHLKKAEATYVELADIYKWTTIECLNEKPYKNIDSIKSVDVINDEIYNNVVDLLSKNGVIK